MKYFQTDDRDDYFASLEKKTRKRPTSYTLLSPDKKLVMKTEYVYKIKKFIRRNYPEFGNAKHIWRNAIESKGYTVINNYETS